jgi:ribosomal protein S18 acetylase RimI-like enzyme
VEGKVIVREARADELAVAARHYLGMRREVGWDDAELDEDWQSRFITTYERGARDGELRYFVAEAGGAIIGSAVAIIKRSLSDGYVRSKPSGYLANVYVERERRREGIARALTAAAIGWLASLDCSVVRLQASVAGRPLYESMGFTSTMEMELTL